MAGIDIISDSTGKEIVAAIQSTDVAQARILEINTAAEAKKNEVLESIPEDYSNISKEVGELKSDLADVSRNELPWDGSITSAKNKFTSTEVVSSGYLYKKGYVKGINILKEGTTALPTIIMITDPDRKIIYKVSKAIVESNTYVEINKQFDTDFYIYLTSQNMMYYNSANVKTEKWFSGSFDSYYNKEIGQTMPIHDKLGHIGFAVEVVKSTMNGEVKTNKYDIAELKKSGIEILNTSSNGMLFSLTDNVVSSFKTTFATLSGCYPCFFNEDNHLRFKLNDETWVIIAKNADSKFIAISFKGTGIIFASFNADGTLNGVDVTQKYLVDSWDNSVIALEYADSYFVNIYRNDNFIMKWDIRHTLPDANIHQFGVGAYSSMGNGVRMSLLPWKELKGKYVDKVNVLGDSFTDNTRDALGTGTFYFTRWYEFAKEICHIVTVNNYGFGGTAMSPVASGDNSFYNRMQSMEKDAGSVWVLGGTNDYHNDVPLGLITDDNTNTFYGTLNKMCEYLKDEFYNADVVFCTPIMRVSPSNGKTETVPANNQTNSNGDTLEQFANAMIEVCRKWGIPCFDAYHNSGICPQARNTKNFAWFMNDGIHMNQNGHRQLGMRFGEFAKQFVS